MANQTGRRNNIYEFKHPDKNRDRRVQEQRRRFENQKRIRRLAMATVGIVAGIILLSLVVWALTRKNGQMVYVGGTPVGIIKGFDYDAEKLQTLAVSKITAEVGTKILVTENVTVEAVRGKKIEINSYDHIVSEIIKNLNYKQEAAIISIDGINMVTVKSKTEADRILTEIMQAYDKTEQNIIEWGIVDDYTVTQEYVSTDEIMSSEMARNILTKQTEVEETYVISSGDSLWQLAVNAGMTLEKLIQINDGITVDTTLRVGQEIRLIIQKPLLSVMTVEEITSNSLKKRSVSYIENPSLPSSYKKTISEGKDGQAIITEHIIRVNGIVREKKQVREKIVIYPVDDVVEIGTKK